MTKLFLDPVYTGRPSTCSTSYLAWEIIKHLSAKYDDAFFYLLVPGKLFDPTTRNEDDWAFVTQMSDRVRLLPYPYQPQDRIAEMNKCDELLAKYLGPAGYDCWDWDVLLTSRVPQLPFMRNVSGRELNYPHGTPRLFLGMDEMPMFSFRDTIAWASNGNMDLASLAAYQSAGGVLMNNLWSKTAIEQVARQWLAPSKVRQLMPSIHECVPVKLERLGLKPRPMGKELRVAFCGRMTGTRNFKEVAELFRKQFSFPLGKNGVEVKFVISTNSLSSGSTKHGDISFVEVQHNDRTKFHPLLDDVHVVVNLSTVEDFSLSTYEPLLHGAPVIVFNKPWTGFLGADYPFRVDNFTQAYAMITAFAKDYVGEYLRFGAWEENTWKGVVEGPQNRTTVEAVDSLVTEHQAYLFDRIAKTEGGAVYREIVEVCNKSDGNVVDALSVARSMDRFVDKGDSYAIPVGKRPNLYLLKPYMNMAGWRDTNQPGVFRRPMEGKS
jgi:hypothetical protein